MSGSWKLQTLDQIAINLDSRRIPITRAARVPGEYPYYGASGIVDYVADFIFEGDALLVSEDGANLLARSTPIAFAASGKYWVNNHAHVLQFPDLATQRFVELYLESISISSYVTGAAQPKLTQKALNSIPIPVPPLSEQRRIVSILDEALEGISTARANSERNLRSARALFESGLEAVFAERTTWPRRRLGGISAIQYGYTQSASLEPIGPRFLRITDIQDNQVDWSAVPFCAIERSDASKFRLAHGDIVFARTGATTGKSFLVIDPPDAVFASYLIRVRLDAAGPSPEFTNLVFQTASYWNAIRSGISGSAQGGFNASKLADLVVPFPASRDEQAAVVHRAARLYEATQRLEAVCRQELAALNDLQRSLLHQAFSGRLTARTVVG